MQDTYEEQQQKRSIDIFLNKLHAEKPHGDYTSHNDFRKKMMLEAADYAYRNGVTPDMARQLNYRVDEFTDAYNDIANTQIKIGDVYKTEEKALRLSAEHKAASQKDQVLLAGEGKLHSIDFAKRELDQKVNPFQLAELRQIGEGFGVTTGGKEVDAFFGALWSQPKNAFIGQVAESINQSITNVTDAVQDMQSGSIDTAQADGFLNSVTDRVKSAVTTAQRDQAIRANGGYNTQTGTVEIDLARERRTQPAFGGRGSYHTNQRKPGGSTSRQERPAHMMSPSANTVATEISRAEAENKIKQYGGYNPTTSTVEVDLSHRSQAVTEPNRYGQKNPLPNVSAEKAEQNRFGALRDINRQQQQELVIRHEEARDRQKVSTLQSASTAQPARTAYTQTKQEIVKTLAQQTPKNLSSEDTVAIKLAQEKQAEAAAKHAQGVVASGGTTQQAKQQLDAVAAIYARGNPDEIRNWENFVKMKQAEKAGTIAQKPAVIGGSADAMERSLSAALAGQSSYVQNSVRAEINKGNKSDVSSLVTWFKTIEKNNASRVPNVPRSNNTRTSTTVIPTTSRGSGGAGASRMM